MLEPVAASAPDTWRMRRMTKLRQMASELRSKAAGKPPQAANTMRQMAGDLERSANRLEDVTVHPV